MTPAERAQRQAQQLANQQARAQRQARQQQQQARAAARQVQQTRAAARQVQQQARQQTRANQRTANQQAAFQRQQVLDRRADRELHAAQRAPAVSMPGFGPDPYAYLFQTGEDADGDAFSVAPDEIAAYDFAEPESLRPPRPRPKPKAAPAAAPAAPGDDFLSVILSAAAAAGVAALFNS